MYLGAAQENLPDEILVRGHLRIAGQGTDQANGLGVFISFQTMP